MENLDITKFSPAKAEITSLVTKYNGLVIAGVDDKAGYLAVDEARKDLKKVRVNIQKTGKSMRERAISFQKEVIEAEKELVGMVEPLERELEAKQEAIDLEKEKIKRRALLPERQDKLKLIDVAVEEDFILLMDDAQFDGFYNQKNAEFLSEKERKMKEEQEKLDAEKRKIEEEKQAQERQKKQQEEIEQARKEAEERTKREMEEKAKKEKEEAERVESEKVAQAEAEQKRLEKDKKYQTFLKKHDYKQGEEFIVQHNGSRVILYKKIDEITL